MRHGQSLFSDVAASAVSEFHDACIGVAGWASRVPARFEDGAWKYIELNHRFNSLLWDEEDRARRNDVGDDSIAANKRAIDKFNQERQNAIEKIDETLLDRFADVKTVTGARQNSETAGSIIDRLSILGLKIFHMGLQCVRTDVDAAHIDACRGKLKVLQQQRGDLRSCLDTLYEQVAAGEAYFKIYRQFKMYNDPTLNPYLYTRTAKNR